MGRPWPRLAYLSAQDEDVPDEFLARAALAGDMRAVEELFRRYEPPIVRYLQRLTRNSEIAVDLFQDTFLRAYVNLGVYDSRRPFRPWLYRIATNLGLDWLRHRTPALPAGGGPEAPPSVEAVVVARDLARQVEQAVAELADDHRTVFLLRHYQQLGYAEIAQIVGSPEGTVRSRMHHSLRILREKLRYLLEEDDDDAL